MFALLENIFRTSYNMENIFRFILRLSFEIKVWLSPQKIHTRNTHTHTQVHLQPRQVRSLLLLFLQRRIGARSLSLSLSLFFFFSSSRSVLSRGDDAARIIYIIYLNREAFSVTVSCVVVVASILWNERVARARVSSLIFFLRGVSLSKMNVVLYYHRARSDLIWSSIRSSIDRRLYSIIIIINFWERETRKGGSSSVWNLNLSRPRGSSEKRHESKKENEPRRFYYLKYDFLRRRNEWTTVRVFIHQYSSSSSPENDERRKNVTDQILCLLRLRCFYSSDRQSSNRQKQTLVKSN